MDFKVKCVGYVEPVTERCFTIGKIYDVVNGVIVRDDGYKYETWSDPSCNPKYENTFKGLCEWFKNWYKFELVTESKYKVGDKVKVRSDLRQGDRYGGMYVLIDMVKYRGKTVTIDRVEQNGKYYGIEGHADTFWTNDMFEGLAVEQNKIVITHDGKTTTATLYRENGSKEVATAKCCPEDTFDFNVGAKLAMERLMKKVEPVPVKKDKYAVGDRIFAEDNINIHPDGAWGTVVEVLDKRYHKEDYMVKFDDGELLCSHVVPVPTTPEPPKYFTGKVICVSDKHLYWTKGKIYTFENGAVIDDDGDLRVFRVHQFNNNKVFLPIVE